MRSPYAQYIPVIKALADETRLKIVHMLADGEACACELLEEFSFTQPTLSYHMKILTESGLVDGVRDGAWMRYTLNQDKKNELIEFIDEITRGTGVRRSDSRGDRCK